MSSFDPVSVRRTVAEFVPQRPQRFQDLAPAKDVIIELRRKRASYRAIAELLTQHCLPTSKTAIASFCHDILGEITRPKRRPNRKQRLPLTPMNGNGTASQPAPAEGTNDADKAETPAARSRGPRIAQVRMLNHQGS